MIAFSRKSVIFEWRRYLPVVISIGISGVLILAQVGLVIGTLSGSVSEPPTSKAQLWVGPQNATSIDQSQGISASTASILWLLPNISIIEPFRSQYVDFSIGEILPGDEDQENLRYGIVMAINTSPEASLFAKAIPTALRSKLSEPGTVVMDKVDASKLGIAVGDTVRINRLRFRVIGLVKGIRGFSLKLIVSNASARMLSAGDEEEKASFYLLTFSPGSILAQERQRLQTLPGIEQFRIWTPEELANSSIKVWVKESGAGGFFITSTLIALIITILVVNQTLGAAVAASIREFAALRAYGLSYRRIQRLVLVQGFYVGIAALGITILLSAILFLLLYWNDIAVELSAVTVGGTLLALTLVIALSNLMAVRRLRHADPASLLR